MSIKYLTFTLFIKNLSLLLWYCYITVPEGGIFLSQIELLATALDYIENNLNNDIKTSDIADACYCSKSTLEKLFRCINNISVRDYIIRRRMTKAAQIISNHPNEKLLDIALHFGYNSNESFTRAFEQVWNCKPSEYRKSPRYYELFPRLICPLDYGDDYMNNRKNVDISELYDLFIERNNCYFVCCDIKSLVPINEISFKAGDLAIIESLNRMNNAAGPEDIVFRIGGDEFALLTNSEDSQYAKEIAEKISAKNGETFIYEDREIPLKLHVGYLKLESQNLRYAELFEKLHTSIKESK